MRRLRGVALVLLFAVLPAGAAAAVRHATPRPTALPRQFVATDLYSVRARRLVRTYLQLRLLELRRSQLDRVEDVIRRNLPLDTLLSEPGAAGSRAPGR